MARTSPHIGNSPLEMMELILQFIIKFNVNRLLYAINGRQLDEEEIVGLKIGIDKYNNKLERQKVNLFKFLASFNNKYTTKDNKRAESSLMMARRMISATAGTKKVFLRFCRTTRKPLPDGRVNVQAYERSMINTKYYSADLFGLSSYPQCVKDLFTIMLVFYENIEECIDECLRRLEQEKETRGDIEKVMELLQEALETSRSNQAHIIMAMDNDPQLREAVKNNKTLSCNPILKEYIKYKKQDRLDIFAQTYFHNCSIDDINCIAINLEDSNEDPEMMVAMAVFGNDKEHIARVNYAIDHFDQLLPENCRRIKIPALLLYFFIECSEPTGDRLFLDYFNKRYLAAGGKLKTISSISAISGARTKVTMNKNGKILEQREEFNEKLKNLLKNFRP